MNPPRTPLGYLGGLRAFLDNWILDTGYFMIEVMQKLIIANWKMNPKTVEEAVALARATDVFGLVIAPPFPFLEAVGKELKNASLGAQDLFWENPAGAFTGEVSADELKALGVRHVIVGHSERRKNLGETDEMVAKKMKTAADAGLVPVLCVGESREEHDAGRAKEVVERELKIGLSLLAVSYKLKAKSLFAVAYEPIWAISTNKNAIADTPQDAVNMVLYIQEVIRTLGIVEPLAALYGGSVNAANAEGFLSKKEIGGALVGGASLKPEEIKAIVAAASLFTITS